MGEGGCIMETRAPAGLGLYSKCERTTPLRSSKSLGNPQRGGASLCPHKSAAWCLHLKVGSYLTQGSFGD